MKHAAMADAIVIGDADKVWPDMLDDHRRGELKSEYRGTPREVAGKPSPQCDLCGQRLPEPAARRIRTRLQF